MKKMICWLLCMVLCVGLLPGIAAQAAGEYTVEVWFEDPGVPGVPIVDFEAHANGTLNVFLKITNNDSVNTLSQTTVYSVFFAGGAGMGGIYNAMPNIPPSTSSASVISRTLNAAPVGPIEVTVSIPFAPPAVPYTHTFIFNNPPAPSKPSGVSGGVVEESLTEREHQKANVTGVQAYANVRSAASTDAEIIGQVQLGETIELLSWNVDESWCKIRYNGGTQAGWLHGRFVKP